MSMTTNLWPSPTSRFILPTVDGPSQQILSVTTTILISRQQYLI